MKEHRTLTKREALAAERSLYRALLTLENEEEYRRFFHDLCTPAELEAMVDRWTVVALLNRGLPYREIHDRTGVSVTTVGRVARVMSEGNGGYQLATDRLE